MVVFRNPEKPRLIDIRDISFEIAQIMRMGWYREVYVKSLESHYVRTLLASRKALLRKCIDNA